MTSSAAGLNICMTADAVGGVWQYATELGAELAAAGHGVTLAVLGPPPTRGQREQAAAIEGLRLIETGLPLDWLSPGPDPVHAAAEEIARLAGDMGADLVHCNMPSLAGAASFEVPVTAVTHGCVATWWHAARDEPLADEFRWHRDLTRRGLAAADAVVAPSASYARLVQDAYGLQSLPLVVHNGRRPAAHRSNEERNLRAALTVGRLWDEVKNARTLDSVAARIDAPFLAAGALRGPHGEEFSPRHLRPFGQLESAELAMLLDLRPVFVSAATFEPFGLAVLEAAAAGCPLVLSDIPTFRELWNHAAIFVDPAEAAGFGQAIASVVDDASRRRTLGHSARERAARYTPAAMARNMERIYTRLLTPAEVAA